MKIYPLFPITGRELQGNKNRVEIRYDGDSTIIKLPPDPDKTGIWVTGILFMIPLFILLYFSAGLYMEDIKAHPFRFIFLAVHGTVDHTGLLFFGTLFTIFTLVSALILAGRITGRSSVIIDRTSLYIYRDDLTGHTLLYGRPLKEINGVEIIETTGREGFKNKTGKVVEISGKTVKKQDEYGRILEVPVWEPVRIGRGLGEAELNLIRETILQALQARKYSGNVGVKE